MDDMEIRSRANVAWAQVAVIETQLRYVQDEGQRQLLLSDLHTAQGDAHYYQNVINQDKGWL